MNLYYDTRISDTVRNTADKKLHRISVRNQTPYVTYNRKTRVLFKNMAGGAFINLGNSRVYFV